MEEVYEKIRKLRIRNKWTLSDLSEKTSLSISFLSQIEKGNTNLAISSLKKIADAYDLNMSYFFDDTDNYSYVNKKSDQTKLIIEGVDEQFIRLHGNFNNRSLEPTIVIIPANTSSSNIYSHVGEEFYYILSGTATFYVNDETYVLESGDSIHFPSQIEHNFENRTDNEVRMMCVVTPSLF